MRYCTENNLDPDKFENGDYGKVIMITREFINPDETENNA